MNQPSLTYPCVVCYKATSMWCGRCEKAWYCSSDHLQTDWPRHKKDCIPATHDVTSVAVIPPPPQTPAVDVTAVVFYPEEDRARIVTVSCQYDATTDDSTCPIPMLDQFFPAGRPESVILTQGLNNEALRFPLHLWFCPTSLSKRSLVNRAIARLTSGQAERDWCGPVVVLKFNGSRRTGYMDAGSNDLPALSAYFLAYK